MLPLILLLASAATTIAIYYSFEPVRSALMRNVFRQRHHVAGELEEMFIFISVDRLQTLKWLIASAMAGLILVLTWEATPPGPLAAAALVAAAGYWSPELLILLMRRKRRIAFSNQLVDALVLLANGLRSGFTMTQSLEMLIEEMPAPISQEFRLVQEEIRIGVDLDQALQNCVARTKDPDLDLVVTAIKITRQLGGNLPEVFDRIVAMVQDRKLVGGKAEALTASGRMQAAVVGVLPYGFGFLLMKLNPDLMRVMWTTLPGFMLLLLAIILDAAGYLWVLKLSRIKY